MDTLPIAVPAAPATPRRPPLPFLAAVVPIVGGIVLWLVTGSMFALCFAALGPLMLGASAIDGARVRRRDGRAEAERQADEWFKAESELTRRHDEERTQRDHRHPDVASALAHPPLRGAQTPDASTPLVIARGSAASEVRASGGDDERSREFRRRCLRLSDAPIVVPLGAGVCLRGTAPLTEAVARALLLQLRLTFGGALLSLRGDLLEDWALDDAAGRSRREGFRVGICRGGEDPPPSDAMIWLCEPRDDIPAGITTLLDIDEPGRARLRTPEGIVVVAVEGISVMQAREIASMQATEVGDEIGLPERVALAELTQRAGAHGLPAVIGRGAAGEVSVDLVDDGPHAIVTGVTGTGKSELLVSWITAMAAEHGPDRVVFVLADFKGGTAFEPLRELVQVAAVITDLDEAGARRGVSSLRAELRRREAVLAAAGARDAGQIGMPRLVIVVDEFAALVQEHPDLGAVFTDVAARGRALGMHLILGTQRASGVVRDALAANCPLRLCLRAADAADSRLMIGTDAAAELPGGAEARGLALVRRPQDTEVEAVRVALTIPADLRAGAVRWASSDAPSSPWPEELGHEILLSDLTAAETAEVPPGTRSASAILGLVDEPERQRQRVELLRPGTDRGLAVLGAPGTGRTAVVRALAAQVRDALLVPADAEGAWDVVMEMAEGRRVVPALVLCDDLDARLAELPSEHAQLWMQAWERVLRGHPGSTFVLTATRASGAVGRLLDMLPGRALLRMPSRVEHIAAGGEGAEFLRDRTPGRAVICGQEMQFAWVPGDGWGGAGASPTIERWVPRADITGIVSSGGPMVQRALREAHPGFEVVLAPEEPGPGRPAIVVGDAETWMRCGPLWQRIRRQGDVLVRAESPGDLRVLCGVRETPPFAQVHAGRAWLLRGADPVRRVVLPELGRG